MLDSVVLFIDQSSLGGRWHLKHCCSRVSLDFSYRERGAVIYFVHAHERRDGTLSDIPFEVFLGVHHASSGLSQSKHYYPRLHLSRYVDRLGGAQRRPATGTLPYRPCPPPAGRQLL